MEIVVPLFRDEYQLIVNAEKTKVGHLDMDVELLFEQSAWRGTRKLGSLQYYNWELKKMLLDAYSSPLYLSVS